MDLKPPLQVGVYLKAPVTLHVKMKPIQPIVWTNHEIEDLQGEIRDCNAHLLSIARHVEHLSKVINNTWVNLLWMALSYNFASWFCSQLKLI